METEQTGFEVLTLAYHSLYRTRATRKVERAARFSTARGGTLANSREYQAVAQTSLNTNQVVKHWDEAHSAKYDSQYKIRDWFELPFIHREYLSPLIAGNSTDGAFDYVVKKYLRGQPRGRALDLGCGPGGIELAGFAHGIFDSAVAFEISSTAIADAKRLATEQGCADYCDFRCEDFLRVDLPNGTFDSVFMFMVMHHILALEELMERVKRWKKPGAYFFVNEYVGPNRFQWTDAVLEHGNRILNTLPERLRVHGVTGEVQKIFWRPSLRGMIDGDPSEAIRSADILPLLGAYFEVVETRKYGGTILQPLLADLVHNFHPEEATEDAEILRQLFAEEQRLISEGTIPANFVLTVVK
jgi:SAM-dependent methyltransferase